MQGGIYMKKRKGIIEKPIKKSYFTNKNKVKIKSKIFKTKVFQDLNIKGGLFKRLVVTFTLLSLATLSISASLIYLVTKQKVSADFEKSTTQILNQNMNYIAFIDNSFENLSKQVTTNKEVFALLNTNMDDTFVKYSNTTKLQSVLNSISSGGGANLVKSIYVLNENGLSVASDGTDVADPGKYTTFKTSEDYKNVMDGDGKAIWSKVHDNIFVASHEKILSYMRLIKDPDTMANAGILVINTDPSIFASSIKDAEIGSNGYMFIADKNGSIIAHKNPAVQGNNVDSTLWISVKTLAKGTFDYSQSGKAIHGVVNTYDKIGWKIIAVVPKNELSATANNIGIISIPIIIVCLILTIILSMLTTLKITNPINKIIGVAEQVSDGDFTVKTDSFAIHEINELSKNFNNMTERLKQMLSITAGLTKETTDSAGQILTLSSSINESSKEIVSAVEEITLGSSKQTEETISCAKISDKFNGEIINTISSLNMVSIATVNTIEIINSSSNTINSLSKTSENNSTAMSKVADTVATLNENTKNILTILNKINSISKQTDLLSLNASIEAARAGEAGKGFSVVANEIRKLAEQSKNASIEIESIVNEVNSSIGASLKISSDAKELFKEELLQVSNTIRSFDEIKTSISNIYDAMKATMNSIGVIDEDKNYLYDAINSIAGISEQNTAATEEVTATIQNQSESNSLMNSLAKGLNGKANELIDIINSFKF
jgi:Methyl-accepting chemotaxis protein